MKRKVNSKTSYSDLIVKLSTECDLNGNVYHMVTCSNGVNENDQYYFEKLSSALVFINSYYECFMKKVHVVCFVLGCERYQIQVRPIVFRILRFLFHRYKF